MWFTLHTSFVSSTILAVSARLLRAALMGRDAASAETAARHSGHRGCTSSAAATQPRQKACPQGSVTGSVKRRAHTEQVRSSEEKTDAMTAVLLLL